MKNASLVHIDEMRTLLEIHYDDLHYETYIKRIEAHKGNRGKGKKRQSEFKVFKSVVNNFKRRLCQRIELPDEVKALLSAPNDDTNWDILEKMRGVVLVFVQGLRHSTVDTEEERQDLAAAIRAGTSEKYWNEIGPGVSWIPAGSRLHLEQEQADIINNIHHEET